MQTVTKNIVGPGSRVYEATYAQAENLGEVAEVIAKLGLSLEQVNESLRLAKKGVYIASLGQTPDTKIQSIVTTMVASGAFSVEEATAIAESKRANMGSGLPDGLKDLNRMSKRGRPKAEAAPSA